MSALGCKGLDDGSTDGSRTASDDSDLPSERFRLGARELCLFERPIFEIEEIGTADRLKATNGFCIACCFDPHLADIDGDGRILEGATVAKHAKAGHQRQARHGIEHGALDIVARIVATEIFGVIGDEGCDVLVDDGTVAGEIIRGRCGQHHRAGLDAD